MNKEFLLLSDPEYTKIEEMVRKTYKNACIVWIEKIHNDSFRGIYENYKLSINPPNEMTLFHGTNEDAARSIIRYGFDPSYSKICAYGKGIYFSKRASYSKDYSKRLRGNDLAFMFVCDVVTGKCCQGYPNKPIQHGFDSATNDIANPDMYIVNRREAAFPHFLVCFYPDAT